MDYRTDKSRAIGMGSAKAGVGHWWSQRITSVALVPLTLLFIFPFAAALGGGHEGVRELYANPFNAIVAILFITVGLYHNQQGLQVVIEDYVHGKLALTAALLANILFNGALALTGIFAIAKIAFTA